MQVQGRLAAGPVRGLPPAIIVRPQPFHRVELPDRSTPPPGPTSVSRGRGIGRASHPLIGATAAGRHRDRRGYAGCPPACRNGFLVNTYYHATSCRDQRWDEGLGETPSQPTHSPSICSTLHGPEQFVGAAFAKVALPSMRVPFLPKCDHSLALGAACGPIFRRILKLLEIVLVCPVVDIHLCFGTVSAFWTIFPVTRVSFRVVEPAQCESPVIPAATVASVRKQDVVVLVVADPVPAALGLGQFPLLATKPTPRAWGRSASAALFPLHHPFPYIRTNEETRPISRRMCGPMCGLRASGVGKSTLRPRGSSRRKDTYLMYRPGQKPATRMSRVSYMPSVLFSRRGTRSGARALFSSVPFPGPRPSSPSSSSLRPR